MGVGVHPLRKGEVRARPGEGGGRAGKADCIAPNERGSLLPAVVIAYDAARGRCH